VYAFDTMTVSPAVSVTYGARYARYDYLDRRALVSPRVAVTVTSVDGIRFGAAVSRRSHAPGAEEFLPPGETGIWLPPQRTFSSIEPDAPMRAEHSTHVMASIEGDVAGATIALRAYRQDITNQLATVFGAELPGQPAAKVGHYLVGNAGDAEALGWVAEFRTAWNDRVRGSITYSQVQARLDPAADLHYLVLVAPSVVRTETERIHDVSTTLEADVPETATKLLVVYRTSNGFARPAAAAGEDRRPFDSRFDVQLRQSLPFMSFSSARWEMLLAVRNFFRETASHQSVYDELLVVRPPTRVVGGVTLYF
jgi:outer membrane receptor protein involved in Fe transport